MHNELFQITVLKIVLELFKLDCISNNYCYSNLVSLKLETRYKTSKWLIFLNSLNKKKVE